MDLEKVPLAYIYKHNGNLNIDFTNDTHDYEVYGFLKLFLRKMEEKFLDEMNEK